MKKSLLIATIISGGVATAQSPEINSWIHNTTGITASYYDPGGALNTMTDEAYCQEVCYNPDSVWIHSSGLYEEMAAWQNPGAPQDQSHVFRIPRNPQPAVSTHLEVPNINAVAYLINGVPIFGLGDDTSYDSSTGSTSPMGDGIWNGNAVYTEGWTINDMGGHPNPGDWAFHTHALAEPLWSTTPPSQHSPIIGYALDGYPIYGPYGYVNPMDDGSPVVRMETGYALRTMSDRSTLPDGSPSTPPGPSDFVTFPLGYFNEDYEYVGSGHLDEYNGRNCITPEYPGGTYAYFVTIDSAGDAAFPYYIGEEYYGEVDQANFSGGIAWPATCVVTGLEETKEVFTFVYPNPGHGVFTVSTDETIESIMVYNLAGKLVETVNLSAQVDLTSHESGIYTARIQTSNGVAVQKFIKE